MRKWLTILAGLFLFFTAHAQNTVHTPLNKKIKDSLKREIENMVADDQKYRWMIQFGELDERKIAEMKKQEPKEQYRRMKDVLNNKTGISRQQKDSLWQLQSAIDSVNFLKMSGIIRTYGYPGKYVSAGKVSTIFLHTPIDIINENFLNTLMTEVKMGNMPGMEYALIYDRVQQEHKQPELYYVMEYYDAAGKTPGIRHPADVEKTNKAREEMGLKKIGE